MAANNNVGYGVKISQLPQATNINTSKDFTVLVQSGDGGNLVTRRTTVEKLLNAVRQNDYYDGTKVENLENVVRTVSGNVKILSIDFNQYSNVNSNNITNLQNATTTLSGRLDNEFRTKFENVNGRIDVVSSDLSALSIDFENFKNDLTSSEELTNTVEQIQAKISIISSEVKNNYTNTNANIENINNSLNNIINFYGNSTETIDFLTDRRDDMPTSQKYISNITVFKQAYNPLNVESINQNYKYFDRYCFGNSEISANDVSAKFSIGNTDNESKVVSANTNSSTTEMPGVESFSLKGIPIRSGMFYTDQNSDTLKTLLKLRTIGNSTVDIYLNNNCLKSSDQMQLDSSSNTTASRLNAIRDEKLLIKINGEQIYKSCIFKAENMLSDDSNMALVWNGKLTADSLIELGFGNILDFSNSPYDLIGMVVPKPAYGEVEDVINLGVSLFDYEQTQNNLIRIQYGIYGGCYLQNVRMKCMFNENTNQISDVGTFIVNQYPKTLNTTKDWINVTVPSGVSTISSVRFIIQNAMVYESDMKPAEIRSNLLPVTTNLLPVTNS